MKQEKQFSTFGLGEPVPTEEVGYARVSDGDSQDPDFQIALLKKRGIPDENIFVDYASGRTMTRPKLSLALKLMAGRPGWTLVVWKLDRLGRDALGLMKLSQEFEQKQWNLVSLTDQIDTRTPMGKCFFGMMAVMAQLESDLISERTKAGVAHRRAKGYRIGRKSKLNAEQWAGVGAALIESNDTIKLISKRYKITPSLVQKHFPGWRSKTQQQQDQWRHKNPLPTQ